MPTAIDILSAARDYLRSNPEELGRAVRNALGLRFGVPLAALRWLGKQAEAAGKVSDLQIDAVPPGIKVGGSVDLMRTPIVASAVVFVERVSLTDKELLLALRLEDVSLKLNGEANTPVAALIKSGALDLRNPGTLASFMPGRSPVIAEAKGNRIVLDFMRDPRLAGNPIVRHALGVLTSFVTLRGVETESDHLDVAFRALPAGVFGAADAVRRHVWLPSKAKFLPAATR